MKTSLQGHFSKTSLFQNQPCKHNCDLACKITIDVKLNVLRDWNFSWACWTAGVSFSKGYEPQPIVIASQGCCAALPLLSHCVTIAHKQHTNRYNSITQAKTTMSEQEAKSDSPKEEKLDAPEDGAAPKEEESTATFEPVVCSCRPSAVQQCGLILAVFVVEFY